MTSRLVKLAADVAVSIFGAEVGADLQADVGAGDVVEPSAVQGADLHVFREFGMVEAAAPASPQQNFSLESRPSPLTANATLGAA